MELVNKKSQPLILLLLVLLILILLSFIPRNAKIGSYSVKPVDMFSDIKAETATE